MRTKPMTRLHLLQAARNQAGCNSVAAACIDVAIYEEIGLPRLCRLARRRLTRTLKCAS